MAEDKRKNKMMDTDAASVREAKLASLKTVLEKTPPELIGDISARGIVLTGGGALVYGMDKIIQAETGIRTYVADDAESCVALGTGKSLDNIHILQGYNATKRRR